VSKIYYCNVKISEIIAVIKNKKSPVKATFVAILYF